MKIVFVVILLFVSTVKGLCQQDFIKIETNKVTGLLNFLETCNDPYHRKSSFKKYIEEEIGEDAAFINLVWRFSQVRLDYSFRREEYPEKRGGKVQTRDLIWMAASNSESIADFSERIIGILPYDSHLELIDILTEIEPYYNELVWEKEQENCEAFQMRLSQYKKDIAALFLQISRFYNANWDIRIPFRIVLYPIPLKEGSVVSSAMGNVLVCGFLSQDTECYKWVLGTIIHEMCHVLYEKQSAKFQHELDNWFAKSDSRYSNVTYSYLNEGLATALGNGWAYEQINGSIDTLDWYNDIFIDGFAHAIFPMVENYMEENMEIDEEFIVNSIELFAQRFPKSFRNTEIVMREIYVFANTQKEVEEDAIMHEIDSFFWVKKLKLETPTTSENSRVLFHKEDMTKLFIVESDHEATMEFLETNFSHLEIETPLNAIQVLDDPKSQSILIIANIEDLTQLRKVLEILSKQEHLDVPGMYAIDN